MSSVQKKISKKNSKLDNKNPSKKTKSEKDLITPEKKVTNEPIEKEMLKGQEHPDQIEEEPKEEKNDNENNNDINNNELNDKEQENIQNSEKPEENQDEKIIQVKPRESYLKEKISKLNFNEKLISNINKSLDTEVQKIKEEIIDDQILITSVPKVFDKKLFEPIHNPQLEQKKIYEKPDYKILKELKEEEAQLKKNLNKILENEKLIKDKSLSKLYSLKQSQSNLSLEKILKIEKLKVLQNQKEKLLQQINDIEFKISEIMNDNMNNELTRKNKLKNFLDNFERDKEIAETRAKKYFQEYNKVNKRIEKDIKIKTDKVKKELEEKEKEEEKKKLDIIQEFKKKQRAIQQKRYKEYMKKALAFKNFIGEKPKFKISEYLYNRYFDKFSQEENKALKLENNKRKEIMKSISRKELKEFALNYDAKKEKMMNEKKEKIIKFKEDWKKRKSALSKYVSSFSEAAANEVKNKEEEEEKILKSERIMDLIKRKKNYSKILKEEKQPAINEKLKQQKLEEINRLENPRQYIIKNTFSYKKNKRIVLKKRDPNKPSKFRWQLKLEVDPFDKSNNSDSSNEILIKRPKKIKISPSFENKEHKPQDKKIDYLREVVAKFGQKKSMSNQNILLTPKNTTEKWNKIINKFKGNFINNVNNIQQKVDKMDREALNKEKKLKIEGGMGQNPELGMEVSNLLIDSIGAKLSILNKIAEMQ